MGLVKRYCPFVFVLIFAVVFFWPIFSSPKTVSSFDICFFNNNAFKELRPENLQRPSNPFLGDPIMQYQPWDLAVYNDRLSFPWLWNPYSACGSPFLAIGQTSVFDIVKHFSYLFGVKKGFGYLCFLKIFLAGFFMCLFLRALGLGTPATLIGAFGYMACGYVIAWLQYVLASSAIFLPLLFYGAELVFKNHLKKGFGVIAMGVALCLFGGHPETAFNCVFAAFCYAVGRQFVANKNNLNAAVGTERFQKWKPFYIVIIAIICGSLIAAVQIIPNIEYIWNSYALEFREGVRAHKLARPGTLKLLRNGLCFLLPNTWGNPSIHDSWWGLPFVKFNYHNIVGGYAGVSILLLSFFSWCCFSWNKVIGIFIFLQLLSYGFFLEIPLVELTIGAIPPFNLANSARFVFVGAFANAVLAAIVFDCICKGKKNISGFSRIWFLIILVSFIGLALANFYYRFAFRPVEWERAYGLKELLHCAVFLIPWLFVPFMHKFASGTRKIYISGLVVLVAADLYMIFSGYNPYIDADKIYPELPAVSRLKKSIGSSRVVPMSSHMFTNIPLVYGLNDPRLYDALLVKSYGKYLEYLGYNVFKMEVRPDFKQKFASMASIRYFWGDENFTLKRKGVRLVYSDKNSKLYENIDVLPHAYVAPAWRYASDLSNALAVLDQDTFPWMNEVVVEESVGGPLPQVMTPEQRKFKAAEISFYSPHRVTVDIPPDSQGILVLNDCFYPGWKVKIDGQLRKMYRTNGTFRGVFISAADKEAEFYYSPVSFKLGVGVSLFSFLFLIALLIFPVRYFNNPTKRHIDKQSSPANGK